jgi:hypothetical protein
MQYTLTPHRNTAPEMKASTQNELLFDGNLQSRGGGVLKYT